MSVVDPGQSQLNVEVVGTRGQSVLQYPNPEQVHSLAPALQQLIQDENKVVSDFSLTFLGFSIELCELQVAPEESLCGVVSGGSFATTRPKPAQHTLHLGLVE